MKQGDFYPLKQILLTALDTCPDSEDDPAVIPQQIEGDCEGADEDDEIHAVAGPKVLVHTNLAKTGSK